jgi:hypothetical protein
MEDANTRSLDGVKKPKKMTGAHGVAPVIWKEGKEKSWEGCRSVPFGSVRFPCHQQVVYQL